MCHYQGLKVRKKNDILIKLSFVKRLILSYTGKIKHTNSDICITTQTYHKRSQRPVPIKNRSSYEKICT